MYICKKKELYGTSKTKLMRGMVFRDALITSFDVITLHLLPVAVAQKLKIKIKIYFL